MPESEDRVLTPAESAAFMRCSEDSIRRAVKAGKLPRVWMTETRWGCRESALRERQERD
jgi:hypothetical protein